MSIGRSAHPAVLAALLVVGASGCSGADAGTQAAAASLSISVDPPVASISGGESVAFGASVTGTANTGVIWSVQEGLAGGSVTPAGVYTAPGTAATYHVVVTSAADSTKSNSATVTVSTSPAPVPTSTSTPGTAVCAAAPLRQTGTVIYYCDCQTGAAAGCVAGNDTNVGTSPASPRRSFADALSRFNGMAAGSTVALCRGGAWAGAATAIYNTNCSASNTCDLRDYVPSWASASAARPRITIAGSNLFNMWQSGHDEGYRYWNLDIRNTSASSGVAFFMMSDVTDVDICNVNVDGGYLHVQDQAGSSGGRNARITVRNSQFSNGYLDSMLVGSNYFTIDSNTFRNNGTQASMFNHTIYIEGENIGGSSPQDTQNVRITNNQILDDTLTCPGVMMVVHGRQTGMVIENNLVQATTAAIGCYGIDVGNGQYPYPCWYRNVVIRRNRVVMANGNEGIGVNSCTGCSITDNVVSMNGQYATGINVPSDKNNGGDVNSGTIIQNNSIYLPNSQNYGIRVSMEGNGYVVENNAVFMGSSSNPCTSITQETLRNANNYCRVNGGADVGRVWTNAPAGDFTPVNPGPLIGAANQTYYSPVAIRTVTWSPTDAGVSRSTLDVGAYAR